MNKNFQSELIKKIYEPKPRLWLSDWSDKNRIMTTAMSSHTGRWNTRFTPYLKQIMDDLSPFSDVREVYVMKAAQLGLTEIGINWMMYIIEQEPARVWYVLPTDKNIRSTSKIRFETALKSHPIVREKIINNSNAKRNDQITMKIFSGGSLQFVSARVAKNLKSEAVKYIFVDELDEAPHDVEGQGSPIELLQHRQATFFDSKLFAVSTPTIKGHSLIEQNYNLSDKRVFLVPCPRCKHYHRWCKDYFDFKKLLMKCDKCSYEYDESHKGKMLQAGQWVSINNPGNTTATIVGYSINSFYSPIGFVSWSDIAKKWFSSYNSVIKLKTFVNQTLGETWSETGSRISEYKLLSRVYEYDQYNDLPEGVKGITAGVDVQGDRLEVEVVGWGINQESWSLEYKVLYGITSLPTSVVFSNLLKFFKGCHYRKAKGTNRNYYINAVAIDYNYRSDVINAFVKRININARKNFYCVRGHGLARESVAIKPTRTGIKTYNLNVDDFKDRLFSHLATDKPGAGYCHFTDHNTKDYFQMLTAEEKIQTENIKGFKFEKIRPRNEALDCRVYAMAASDISGMTRGLEVITE